METKNSLWLWQREREIEMKPPTVLVSDERYMVRLVNNATLVKKKKKRMNTWWSILLASNMAPIQSRLNDRALCFCLGYTHILTRNKDGEGRRLLQSSKRAKCFQCLLFPYTQVLNVCSASSCFIFSPSVVLWPSSLLRFKLVIYIYTSLEFVFAQNVDSG